MAAYSWVDIADQMGWSRAGLAIGVINPAPPVVVGHGRLSHCATVKESCIRPTLAGVARRCPRRRQPGRRISGAVAARPECIVAIKIIGRPPIAIVAGPEAASIGCKRRAAGR